MTYQKPLQNSSVYFWFQVTRKMEGVTKALDKAMSSMDLEKVFAAVFFASGFKVAVAKSVEIESATFLVINV